MDTEVEIKNTDKLDISKPKKYNVILYNDDSTPMEFVIELLRDVFGHTDETANEITLKIHNDGKGVAGVYYYEIAEQKVAESISVSRGAGYPLALDLEEL
jgi:ATP-dependent Clp protease adaptor protein ClpS|tara:strand:- start:573 stop:872 length:300 start_codon:yes stop_codon:yes gene_type:complete